MTDALALFPPASAAALSDCGRYRYSLLRVWEPMKPLCFWCCLNPSVADAERTDPSLTRMCGFTLRWGFGGLWLVNEFALRATDPRVMLAHPEPVGPGCDAAIAEAASLCSRWIVAWGVDGSHQGRDRQVMTLLAGLPVECLGVTKGGQPRHPLYLAGRTEPRAYTMGGAA